MTDLVALAIGLLFGFAAGSLIVAFWADRVIDGMAAEIERLRHQVNAAGGYEDPYRHWPRR